MGKYSMSSSLFDTFKLVHEIDGLLGIECLFLILKSISIRVFVGPFVVPSVRRSRVSRKPQIQVNSTKFTTFRSYWPGDGLVYRLVKNLFLTEFTGNLYPSLLYRK